MTLLDGITFKAPVLRVNNRNRSIDFYKRSLGFTLLSEENALAIFTACDNRNRRFTIEESPSTRTRAAEGAKKLDKIIVKAAKASDIEALLSNGAVTHQVFKGKNGYAFETISPEGDHFILHAEDKLADLSIVDRPVLPAQPEFKGLSDYSFEEICLNVLSKDKSETFYRNVFDGEFPLKMSFVETQGPDLQVEPSTTWDIEILECQMPAEYDLGALKSNLEEKGYDDIYLDAKQKVLVISDPSNIEIWFIK